MNRKRLTPDQSRAAAVAAARDLLREEGVAAITLKSVAARIGRTHANLLHHFGSVAELHRALAEEIARSVAASITGSIGRMRRGEARLRKRPSTSELIDWIAALRKAGVDLGGIGHGIPFLGTLLKNEQDMGAVTRRGKA